MITTNKAEIDKLIYGLRKADERCCITPYHHGCDECILDPLCCQKREPILYLIDILEDYKKEVLK